MKKIISLMLAFVLCLSFCACGANEQYKILEEKMVKYQSLIDLLEAEDYEGAIADIKNRMPVPEYEVVEITLDNWDKYFEIVPDYYWYENAFGEGEALNVGFSLFLKDEYVSRLPSHGDSTIACTVSFDAREKTLNVNWKEKTFTEVPYTKVITGMSSSGMDGGRWPEKVFEQDCEITSELKNYDIIPPDKNERSNLFYVWISQYDDTELYNFYFGENFAMVRMAGTLELLAE